MSNSHYLRNVSIYGRCVIERPNAACPLGWIKSFPQHRAEIEGENELNSSDLNLYLSCSCRGLGRIWSALNQIPKYRFTLRFTTVFGITHSILGVIQFQCLAYSVTRLAGNFYSRNSKLKVISNKVCWRPHHLVANADANNGLG